MTQDTLSKALALKGKVSIREASRQTGVCRSAIITAWDGRARVSRGTAAVAPVAAQKKPAKAGVLTIKDVVVQYDLVGKVIEQLSKLQPGEVWKDESLRMEMATGADRWRRATGSTRLAGYWEMLPDKSRVWGSKATITRLSAQIKEL